MTIVSKNKDGSARLTLDDKGNLWNGSRVCFNPCFIDKRYREGPTRKNVTGSMTTEFFGRDPRLYRITESDGSVWWNIDDGTRLATPKDIELIRAGNDARSRGIKQPSLDLK